MQTFVINLTKPIAESAFLQKWAEEPSGRPRVQFSFNGSEIIARVHSGHTTPWEKGSFVQFLGLVLHKADRGAQVSSCTLKAWQVVTDRPGTMTGMRFYDENEAVAKRDELNRQTEPGAYMVLAADE